MLPYTKTVKNRQVFILSPNVKKGYAVQNISCIGLFFFFPCYIVVEQSCTLQTMGIMETGATKTGTEREFLDVAASQVIRATFMKPGCCGQQLHFSYSFPKSALLSLPWRSKAISHVNVHYI